MPILKYALLLVTQVLGTSDNVNNNTKHEMSEDAAYMKKRANIVSSGVCICVCIVCICGGVVLRCVT